MRLSKSDACAPTNAVGRLQKDLLALVRQMVKLAMSQRKALVILFAELLRPRVIPVTPLDDVLEEAARRAGWVLPSLPAQRRQQTAAQGRKIQREQDQAHRRVLVSYIFKHLPRRLQARPGSKGTAQAIIARLEELPFERKPPYTVRTIQEDIRSMKESGGFGI